MMSLIARRFQTFVALALLAVGVLVIMSAGEIHADSFTVNTETDLVDDNPGDGTCSTASGKCSLRAAIMETNALPGRDVINLPKGSYTLSIPEAFLDGPERGDLDITDSLGLVGAGVDTTFIDGNDTTRVLEISHSGIDLLVADSQVDNILRFTLSGNFNDEFVRAGSGGIGSPISMAIGPDRDLYVADFSLGVVRYDGRSGAFEEVFIPSGTGGLLGPTGLTFGPDGNLYVTVFQPGGGILRFDGDTGAFLDTFVAAGTGGLAFPNSIVFGPDDNLYVTSTGTDEVLRFDGDTGASLGTFVSAFSGGLSTPRELIFGPDGNLYVVSDDNERVLRYNGTTGAFISTFVGTGSGGLDNPSGIQFGPDRNLYVTSLGTGSILRYDETTGDFIDEFIPQGRGGIAFPSAILFAEGMGTGPIVNISGLTIQNGNAGTSQPGGGILIGSETSLSMSNGAVQNNKTRAPGGGVANAGFFQLFDSTIESNALPLGTGGGVQHSGGGIANFTLATAEIVGSAIISNEATRGGGIVNFGDARLRIRNSTVSGNKANTRGGGIMNFGGNASISFTTITNNEANAIFGGTAEPSFGGGIYNTGAVSIGNTILAGNTDNRSKFDPRFSPDCFSGPDPSGARPPGTFTSFRGNLVGILNENCELRDTFWGDTRFDMVGTEDSPLDPRLAGLLNGTHRLLGDSRAIDNGTGVTSARFFDCPDTDQRGFGRPVDGDGMDGADCDVGAYEFGATNPDTDDDGVDNVIENGAPNGGDGNNDGFSDDIQDNVASLPNFLGGGYATLVSTPGTSLSDVRTRGNPSPSDAPSVEFPVGFFDFRIQNVAIGGTTTVTLILPPGTAITSYHKYGPTPDNTKSHWYEFLFFGNIGAVVSGNQITLHFQDGERGDSDLTANGEIVDPGAPTLSLADSGPPTCELTAFNDHIVEITVQDIGSGLAAINIVGEAHGVDLEPISFDVGTTDPLVITAIRRNPDWEPFIHLEIIDVAGNVTKCVLQGQHLLVE